MAFECVSRTDVGLRRSVNEDSMLDCTERGYWAVADGMGGHEAGDVASARVTEALRLLPGANDLDELVDSAVVALQRVNRELIELAASNGSQRTIGTTVVGLAAADGQYRCFWAGDSRAYRIRDGQIVRLTSDHSVVQGLVDAGLLAPDQAEGHPNSNLITRAVGVADELKIDVVGGDVQPGDSFLLATDGLTRLVDDDELLAAIASRGPADAADFLVETVLARGAPDNVTLIVAKAS